MAPRLVTRWGRSPLPRSMSSATALVGALAIAATIGACGPGEGAQATGPGPRTPTAGTAPSATAPAVSSPSPTPAPPAASTGATATSPAPPSPPSRLMGPMKPIAPSAMEAKLRAIGLDPAALPPLNKLDAKTLRDVMNTFTKALGVQCSHCHEKDFRAPTAKKKIATHMWNDFTRALALEGGGSREGGAIYCDSCHRRTRAAPRPARPRRARRVDAGELRRQDEAGRQEGPRMRDLSWGSVRGEDPEHALEVTRARTLEVATARSREADGLRGDRGAPDFARKHASTAVENLRISPPAKYRKPEGNRETGPVS